MSSALAPAINPLGPLVAPGVSGGLGEARKQSIVERRLLRRGERRRLLPQHEVVPHLVVPRRDHLARRRLAWRLLHEFDD